MVCCSAVSLIVIWSSNSGMVRHNNEFNCGMEFNSGMELNSGMEFICGMEFNSGCYEVQQ